MRWLSRFLFILICIYMYIHISSLPVFPLPRTALPPGPAGGARLQGGAWRWPSWCGWAPHLQTSWLKDIGAAPVLHPDADDLFGTCACKRMSGMHLKRESVRIACLGCPAALRGRSVTFWGIRNIPRMGKNAGRNLELACLDVNVNICIYVHNHCIYIPFTYVLIYA